MDIAVLVERPHCLILDADAAGAAATRTAIVAHEPGVRLTTGSHLRHGLKLLAGLFPPSAVISEAALPDAAGPAEIIRALRARRPGIPVLVWTDRGSEEAAVASLRAGAVDYIAKRAGTARLLAGVGELLGRAILAAAATTTAHVADAPAAPGDAAGLFVARSPAMRRVLRLIDRASHSAVPVLLHG